MVEYHVTEPSAIWSWNDKVKMGQKWSGRWDSNPRPSRWQRDALSAELRPRGLENEDYIVLKPLSIQRLIVIKKARGRIPGFDIMSYGSRNFKKPSGGSLHISLEI